MSGAATSSTCAPALSGAVRNKELFLTKEEIALRLAYVVDRLASWLKSGSRTEPATLMQLCYILARGIDFSVTAGEVYAGARDLPPLVKQVYKFKNETSLQPAMMMLLLSIKNACRQGWFSDEDEKELIAMGNEMSSNFCYGSSLVDESKVSSVISKIMPRFYPLLKFEKLITAFEAKVGYQILVVDFNIPLNSLPQACMRLFVARTDENMETSSCLITPPHVNFLINGRPVERRTCGFSDLGPQFPTNVTKVLKYGTNLIQAIGSFGGQYVIAIVSMSTLPIAGVHSLQDYVSPDFEADPQDDDLVEGPSKVSLNCPISLKRIKTPVKGHLCKHHQCFDYENYMAINAKRPSWRCPHCNQPVSFVDLRIDRQMGKILADTGENATHVVIGPRGLWKIVNTAEQLDKIVGSDQTLDASSAHEPNEQSSVVDLTVEDAEDLQARAELFDSLHHHMGGRKPLSEALQAQGQLRDDKKCGIPSGPAITDAVSPAIVRERADMGSVQFLQNQTQTDVQTQDLVRNISTTLSYGFQAQDFPVANTQTGRQTISTGHILSQSGDSQQQWNLINSRPPLSQQSMSYYSDGLCPQNNITQQQTYNNGHWPKPQALNHLQGGQSSGNGNQQPCYYNSPWPQQVTHQVPTSIRPGLIPAHQQARGFAWPGQSQYMARPNNPQL